MSAYSFEELMWHVGHNIVVATYGDSGIVYNVAIECEDCHVVLLDFNNPEYEEDDEEGELEET